MSPTRVLGWASGVVGHAPEVVGHRVGDNTEIWVLRSATGGLVIKRHGAGRGFEQERQALERWAPHLPCATPRLVAQDREQRLLALTRLPGTPVPAGALEAAARQAGAVLRTLHGLPVPGSPDRLPLAQACRRRFESALEQAREHLPLALWNAARDCLAAVDLGDPGRVPCHRDFSLHNWLWHEGRLGVVDFEHARADHPLADWVKLLTLPAPARQAVLSGLAAGGANVPPRSPVRDAFMVAYHLGTLVWSARRGDEGGAHRARRALARSLEISLGT